MGDCDAESRPSHHKKNSSEWENSPDLYNLNTDLKMVTIAELVNAIDGFLKGAVYRDILKRQIRDATDQIRIKNNNLHQDLRKLRRACDQLQQDLVREQRRRYDTEGKYDNKIIQRQLSEGMEARVIGDLQQLWTNAQNQVNRIIANITRKQTRIGNLVQEKFALQLLYQQNAHHLQWSRGDIGLLEYNRDRLYDWYEK